MAKIREPLSICDAVRKAHAALGDGGVKEVTGKSAALVTKWSDPDADGHNIPFGQAIALDVAMVKAGEMPPHLEVIKAAIEDVLPFKAAPPPSLTEQTLKITASVGALSQEVTMALADKMLKPAEKQRLMRCIEEQMAHLHAMKRGLRR